MFDEADLYIPANAKPATAEPLQSLLKRARSAGLGIMLATQSPGDLDYKSRDQITSWFIGRVREDTALRKLRAAFQSESGPRPRRRAAGPDGRRVPSGAGRAGAADAGAALAHQRRAGAVRPHRAAGARDQGPGREAVEAVRVTHRPKFALAGIPAARMSCAALIQQKVSCSLNKARKTRCNASWICDILVKLRALREGPCPAHPKGREAQRWHECVVAG